MISVDILFLQRYCVTLVWYFDVKLYTTLFTMVENISIISASSWNRFQYITVFGTDLSNSLIVTRRKLWKNYIYLSEYESKRLADMTEALKEFSISRLKCTISVTTMVQVIWRMFLKISSWNCMTSRTVSIGSSSFNDYSFKWLKKVDS